MAKKPGTPTSTPAKPKEAITLEDIMISLQKSFSRVSYKTAQAQRKNEGAGALAIISGPVEFQVTLKVRPGEDETILYDEKGSVELSLKGEVTPDIRLVSNDEADDAS